MSEILYHWFCSVAVITPDSDPASEQNIPFRQPRFDSGQDLPFFLNKNVRYFFCLNMVSELTNSKHLSRQTFDITQHWLVRQDVVEILGTET
jgi:hypothetical protein